MKIRLRGGPADGEVLPNWRLFEYIEVPHTLPGQILPWDEKPAEGTFTRLIYRFSHYVDPTNVVYTYVEPD